LTQKHRIHCYSPESFAVEIETHLLLPKGQITHLQFQNSTPIRMPLRSSCALPAAGRRRSSPRTYPLAWLQISPGTEASPTSESLSDPTPCVRASAHVMLLEQCWRRLGSNESHQPPTRSFSPRSAGAARPSRSPALHGELVRSGDLLPRGARARGGIRQCQCRHGAGDCGPTGDFNAARLVVPVSVA
jgi:hypothetical protein